MTMKVAKIDRDDQTFLYCKFEGNMYHQDCYIEIHLENETIDANCSPYCGNSVSADVFNGLSRTFKIPLLTADACNDLMESLLPLANKMLKIYNKSGSFSEEMEEIYWEITEFIRDRTEDGYNAENEISVWSAEDFFGSFSDEDFGFSKDTKMKDADDIAITLRNEYTIDENTNTPLIIEDLEMYIECRIEDFLYKMKGEEDD